MPAKRPAPKSAKGKKAASRPVVRKAVGRKAEPVRARGAVAHARKIVAAPKKPLPPVPAAGETVSHVEFVDAVQERLEPVALAIETVCGAGRGAPTFQSN